MNNCFSLWNICAEGASAFGGQFHLPATLDHLRSGGNAEFRIMKFGG
jgi:hypothetical protein